MACGDTMRLLSTRDAVHNMEVRSGINTKKKSSRNEPRLGSQYNNAQNLHEEHQVSSPKDNKVLFDFFDFFTEAELF